MTIKDTKKYRKIADKSHSMLYKIEIIIYKIINIIYYIIFIK